MIKRSKGVQAALDNLARKLGNLTQKEGEERGVCVVCKKPVGTFNDLASQAEYEITGTCQTCQDWIFSEPEGEDEDDTY